MKVLVEEWKKRDREREIIMKKKVKFCFYRERERFYVFCFVFVYFLRVSLLNFIFKCLVKYCYKGVGRVIKVIVFSKFIKYFND